MTGTRAASIWWVLLCCASVSQAQIDPFKRELIQLGYNAPLQGHAPISAYAFYYLNVPDFHRTNVTFRLALAPVYLDSEVGLRHLLGPNTDLGLGIAGDGFADSYAEIREGKWERDESFTGHEARTLLSVYHRFNPEQKIPLTAVIRGEAHYATYSRDNETAPTFTLPEDGMTYHFRTSLRWGGQEPLLAPEFAMELSGWYEGAYRTGSGTYGFNDRKLETFAHLFWGRALLAYTFPKTKQSFYLNLTMGTSIDSDRFSAYRLGGLLPLAAEFPLNLPGYYYQEISARRFVLLGGIYNVPLDPNKDWSLHFEATTAGVDYVEGLEQPGHWHSGVGGGVGYKSPSGSWQVVAGYAYGIDAIRDHGRGAHSVGFLVQFDLERAHVSLFEPGEAPSRSRGLQRIFRF